MLRQIRIVHAKKKSWVQPEQGWAIFHRTPFFMLIKDSLEKLRSQEPFHGVEKYHVNSIVVTERSILCLKGQLLPVSGKHFEAIKFHFCIIFLPESWAIIENHQLAEWESWSLIASLPSSSCVDMMMMIKFAFFSSSKKNCLSSNRSGNIIFQLFLWRILELQVEMLENFQWNESTLIIETRNRNWHFMSCSSESDGTFFFECDNFPSFCPHFN